MPIKRPSIANGEIYHVVSRAIEGLKLFRDEKDYFRMVHDLFEFNNENSASSNYRHWQVNAKLPRSVLGSLERKPRKMLVEILALCLMPNHIHLLLRQTKEGGISKFMRKIGAGYGGYFNKKHRRKGRLFDGRYKIVHIKNDKQLITVFIYIHTNPIAIIFPNWKEKGIKDLKQAVEFLENYKWSSYLDYLGNKNFPSLTSREFLIELMGKERGCKDFVDDWLRFKKELADFDKVAIE